MPRTGWADESAARACTCIQLKQTVALQRVPGRKAPEAADAAAYLVVDFNAPQPPPRPSKPSLAALAKAERERPHPR